MAWRGLREVNRAQAAAPLQGNWRERSAKIVCISTSRVPSSTANSIQVMKACQALGAAEAQCICFCRVKASLPWER
jgi:hypothetical protein